MHEPGHYQDQYEDSNYLYEYLIPLLQETVDGEDMIYNPDVFLAHYGQYLTGYDPSREYDVKTQDKLLFDTTLAQNIGTLRTAENVAGATGFSGSGSMSRQVGMTLDKIIGDLKVGDLQALEASKSSLKQYEQSLYSELGTLAMLGAFQYAEQDWLALQPLIAVGEDEWNEEEWGAWDEYTNPDFWGEYGFWDEGGE